MLGNVAEVGGSDAAHPNVQKCCPTAHLKEQRDFPVCVPQCADAAKLVDAELVLVRALDKAGGG